jgi:hypothetical protein
LSVAFHSWADTPVNHAGRSSNPEASPVPVQWAAALDHG